MATTGLTTYEPYDRLSQMMRSADQMMERFFGAPFWANGWSNGGTYEGSLPVDISETESEIVVRASLPGFRQEDIDLQLHQGVLTIKANPSWAEAEGGERYHRRERGVGPVSRRIALPGLLYDAEVNAELRDGVLTVRVPIPQEARPKHIQIKAAA